MADDEVLKPARGFVVYRMALDIAGHLPRDGGEELLDLGGLALGDELHVAVGQVADVAGDRETASESPGGVAEADALDVPGVQHAFTNGHGIAPPALPPLPCTRGRGVGGEGAQTFRAPLPQPL